MKAREWQRFMDTQRRQHAKTVFSVTELANAAGVSLHVLNVELGRLVRQGVVVRYARGKYGLPGAVAPEELLSALDAHAYLTGAYALHRHNLVTQAPTEITCFTNRRHNRSRARTTPVGRFTFVCVSPQVYALPRDSLLAGPAQALCDFVYLLGRHGLDPRALVTFRRLDVIHDDDIAALGSRYPATVLRAVEHLRHGGTGAVSSQSL